jgi:rubrerythrin
MMKLCIRSFTRQAVEDGRSDAAANFRLALEREKHHRAMFKEALKSFRQMKATA